MILPRLHLLDDGPLSLPALKHGSCLTGSIESAHCGFLLGLLGKGALHHFDPTAAFICRISLRDIPADSRFGFSQFLGNSSNRAFQVNQLVQLFAQLFRAQIIPTVSDGTQGILHLWACHGALMGSIVAALLVLASFLLLHDFDNSLSFK